MKTYTSEEMKAGLMHAGKELELEAVKEQLKEANLAIDEFREHGVCSLLNVYHAKHLKPVDPLK